MNRVKIGRVVMGMAMRSLALAGVGCLLAFAVSGCLRPGKTTDNDSAAAVVPVDAPVKPEFRYKVVAEQTNFFHISPQQAAGPDEKLKRETRVTLLKRYGGFSQVKTVGGISGYVASDEITRLSPQEISQEEAALLARQAPPAALAPMPNGPGGNYAIPPEATRDTVLPVPDAGVTPKPSPNPMFRY